MTPERELADEIVVASRQDQNSNALIFRDTIEIIIKKAMEKARLEERERCAKIVESFNDWDNTDLIATKIRKGK